MTDRNAILEALVFIAHEIIDRVYDEDGTHRDMADDIAAAVLELIKPKELMWSGEEDDCYMQTTTSTGVYCIGVINDGWYAEFDAHTALRPVSLGWHHNDAAAAQAAAEAHHIAAYWAQSKIGGE